MLVVLGTAVCTAAVALQLSVLRWCTGVESPAELLCGDGESKGLAAAVVLMFGSCSRISCVACAAATHTVGGLDGGRISD
jgi:hypothetical protein